MNLNLNAEVASPVWLTSPNMDEDLSNSQNGVWGMWDLEIGQSVRPSNAIGPQSLYADRSINSMRPSTATCPGTRSGLEQREGSVDRYGQRADRPGWQHVILKSGRIRYFSPDSPLDGVVLRVLLDNTREIYKTLGTHVPVPEGIYG
jgi:hypothetical protein